MDLADEVKQDIENRIIKGVREYGERLKPFNGRDALLDAYEECLDQALYLKQELTERQAIQGQAKVSKTNTDIEKQESIVNILGQFLDEIESDDRIISYRKIGETTFWEQQAIGNALQKILDLDNLKIVPIE